MSLGGHFPGEDQWQGSAAISKKEKDEQKAPKFDFAGTMSYSWNMGWEGGEVMERQADASHRKFNEGQWEDIESGVALMVICKEVDIKPVKWG